MLSNHLILCCLSTTYLETVRPFANLCPLYSGHTARLHFPGSLAVGGSHVIEFSQWSVGRSDVPLTSSPSHALSTLMMEEPQDKKGWLVPESPDGEKLPANQEHLFALYTSNRFLLHQVTKIYQFITARSIILTNPHLSHFPILWFNWLHPTLGRA